MNVSVELDNDSHAELERAIERLTDVSNETASEVLRSQGRLLCADLAQCTRPIGKSPNDGAELRDRIKSKIDSIYWPVGRAVEALKRAKDEGAALAFQRMIRQRRYSQAAALLTRYVGRARFSVGEFDGGRLHKAQRWRRDTNETLVVTNKGAITAYARKMVKAAGWTKSGFATAAKMLGGSRGIPGYVSRLPGPGRGVVVKSNNGPTLIIQNDAKGIRAAFDLQLEGIAVQNRTQAIAKLISRINTNRLRKASPSLK